MANTYTQIYIQYVFGVKYRACLIDKKWSNELYKYMTGTITNKGHKVLSIGGVADHIHILVSMSPVQAPSALMADVKRSSSLWINENHLTVQKFSWQEGFGAFSYKKSQIHSIANYIENQEIHHQKQTFTEEYIEYLKQFEIDYDEQYIFKDVE